MKKFLILLLLVSNSVQALEVKFLEKGQEAPYAGFLFEPKAESRCRLLDQELDYNKQINASLTNMNNLYEQNATVMQNRILNLQQQVNNNENTLFSKTGFFILGVATTILVAFATSRATR